MTRIRYSNVPGTFNFVTKPVLAGTKRLVVNINTEKNVLVVTEADTATVVHTQPGENFREMKNTAKKLLKDFGARFSDEVRRKRSA